MIDRLTKKLEAEKQAKMDQIRAEYNRKIAQAKARHEERVWELEQIMKYEAGCKEAAAE